MHQKKGWHKYFETVNFTGWVWGGGMTKSLFVACGAFGHACKI